MVGNPPRKVQVVFFSPDGLQRIDPSDIIDVHLGNDRRAFYRRVPGPELAEWTRKTDIFVVTHGESMGLPVLENAMAGALIVAHQGFVKPELLRSLEHHEYSRVELIDWDSLVERIHPVKARRRASHFTWSQVAQRMLDTFTGRDRLAIIEPDRTGGMLVAPPSPINDRRFGSLAAWRARNVRIEPAGSAERMIPTSDKPVHYARHDLAKHPWPETFTMTFTVRPNGRDDVSVWLCGEIDDERAEVRIDLATLQASPGRTTNGWVLLDAKAVRVGDEVLCQVVAQSDYAPILRCYLLLARNGKLEFQVDGEEPGMEFRRLQLGKGIGLIADLRETASPAIERPIAANG